MGELLSEDLGATITGVECDNFAGAYDRTIGGFQAEGLLQQPRDAAGIINPDLMRPVDSIHAVEKFAAGSAVASLASHSDQMFSPINGEGALLQPHGLVGKGSFIVSDSHFCSQPT